MKTLLTNKFKVIAFFALFLAFFTVPVSPTSAAHIIDVEFGPGFAINETDLVPGGTVSRSIKVTNLSNSSKELAIKMNLQQGAWQALTNNIEEVLYIQIKKPGGNFSVLPNGTNKQILEELDGNSFVFDNLPGPNGNSKTYELLVSMDINAGNEYQGKKVVFDISAGIEAQTTPADDDDDDDNDGKKKKKKDGDNDEPNIIPASFFTSGNITTTPEQDGSQEEGPPIFEGEEGGGVAGVQTECENRWPLWVWIVLILIYITLFSLRCFKKYEENEEKNIRWKLQTLYLISAFIIWYFFDNCRDYIWFIYIAVIAGFVLYLIYLYYLRRKISSSKDNLSS